MEIKIKELPSFVSRFINKKKPVFVHGAPGIGKSYVVKEVAKAQAKDKGLNFVQGSVEFMTNGEKITMVSKDIPVNAENSYCFIDVRITSLDPSDIRGVPMPSEDKKCVKWLNPNWLPKNGQGLIFLDELNLAAPSIQASAYQLVLDRRVGDYLLPDGYSIVAAGNRAIDKANVFTMAAPLKNRFAHLELTVPSDEEWRDWALENNIAPDIIGFLAFKTTLLFKFETDSKSNAFPTPRTWAMASCMIEGETDQDVIIKLIGSCVGDAVAIEYSGFLKLKNTVNLDDIIKNPEKVKDIKDPGLKYAVISGISEKYRSNKKLMEPILKVVQNIEPDFGVFMLRMMKGVNPNTFIKDLLASKTFQNHLSEKYRKYLC